MKYKNSYKFMHIRKVSEKNAKKLNCSIYGKKLSNDIYFVIDYINDKFYLYVHGSVKHSQRVGEKDEIIISGLNTILDDLGIEAATHYRKHFKQTCISVTDSTKRKLLAMAYDHIEYGITLKRVVFFIDSII